MDPQTSKIVEKEEQFDSGVDLTNSDDSEWTVAYTQDDNGNT